MDSNYFAGIDIGSSTAKAVIINDKNEIINYIVEKTGTKMQDIALSVYNQCKNSDIVKKEPSYVVSTGYGRKNVEFADTDITEITCSAKGSFYYFPQKSTIIDIGGQDNKVIFINGKGIIREFKLNRKCAAGTGAFLEEICWRLDIPIEKMQIIAQKGKSVKSLNSYCSVFASTEILERIRNGEKIEDMLISAYYSIIRRIFDMAQLESPVVLSGGVVQYHIIIENILKEKYGLQTLRPEIPQILPAFGAALIAKEKYLKNGISEKKTEINVAIK
ncbi:MAG: R-phenyllactate dehydratase activator [Candidatus Heimdallarchaeota archaeon LC_3]|nr:MAG: R-phenyllactate dehydratase activator [Candidatus Heimdallarchaeota archaeon LC_3]